jgi:hypothetical protein
MRRKFKPDRARDPRAIRSIDIDAAGRELVVGRHSSDGSFRLGVLDAGSLAWTADYSGALQGAAALVRFEEDARSVLYQDERDGVWLLERAGGANRPLTAEGERAHYCSCSSNGVVALSGARVTVRSLSQETPPWQLEPEAGWGRVIAAVNWDGSGLAVAGEGIEGVLIFDAASRSVCQRLPATLTGAWALEFDHSGAYLALVGGGMQGCTVWDLRQEAAVGDIFCHPGQNNNHAQDFHPRLPFVAFGTIAGYIVLVDLKQNEMVYMEQLHPSRIWALRFSPDGKHLFSAGDDGVLWRIEWDEMISIGVKAGR